MQVSNYSHIQQIGSKYASKIFDGAVVIQEKVDGSQFSFANIGGKLLCRSKNQPVGIGGNEEGMFARAVRTAKLIFDTGTLPVGMVVRCECLDKPRQNIINYSRVPIGNIIIYDIELHDRSGDYLRPPELEKQAKEWGLETVPLVAWGELSHNIFRTNLTSWLDRESVLGGAKIEGIVVKNYLVKDHEDNILMCKYVSERFKERMDPEYKTKQTGTVIEKILGEFNREAIWAKAVQHLRDSDTLVGSNRDIGNIIKETLEDFERENGDEIKERIVKEYFKVIKTEIVRGLPEWYKASLLPPAVPVDPLQVVNDVSASPF